MNLSAIQLTRSDLAPTILETLDRVGLPPDRLDLELTKSLLIESDGQTEVTLGQLRKAGTKSHWTTLARAIRPSAT